MRSLEIPPFPWRMPPFLLHAPLATLNLIQQARGWRRRSFIVVGHSNWIRICPKAMSPTLFSYGGHQRISNTLKRLPNSSEPWPCRVICRTPTTDWARSWHTSGYSITLAKCMRGGGLLIPRRAVSHSIVQVYIWNQDYDLARKELQAWRAENPGNKYPIYFAPQLAMMTGDWKESKALLDEAVQLLPEEPLIVSLQGVFYALTGNDRKALDCLAKACASPRSFGHAHHSYYQIACILALLGRREAAFGWLERSVSSGFACWPFFLKDSCLKGLRELPGFEVLVSSLQAKYPDHLGLL